MRSRFRIRFNQKIASLLMRWPGFFLTRIHFVCSFRVTKPKSKEFVTEEFRFDRNNFSYNKSEGITGNVDVIGHEVLKDNLKKEFSHLLKLLRKAGFVYASCGNHFDYEGMPTLSQSRQYELKFFFLANENPFLTIEKYGDEWYGIDYNDLEKFEVFESYLRKIAHA